MDLHLYDGLQYFFENEKPPSNYSPKDREKVISMSKYFNWFREKLWFRRTKEDKWRLVIKENEDLKKILNEGHGGTAGGHFAGEATKEKIKRNFYWPRMDKMIEDYIKTCETCQRTKKPPKNNLLQSIKVSSIFELIGLDLVGPLPETTSGNKYILVMTEYLSKWVEAKAIPNKRAATVAEVIYNEIIVRFGTPKRMLTDQGTEFLNETLTALQKVMNIKGTHSSPYHPQTNGQAERTNETLCKVLDKLSKQGREWDKWIGAALYAYRTKKHSSTKFTPSMLLYGFEMETPITIEFDTNVPEEERLERSAQEHMDLIGPRLKHIREIARQNKEKAQESQKKYYDRKTIQTRFKMGDKVLWLDSAKTAIHGDKFREIYHDGIFTIHEVFDNGSYRLKGTDGRITKITSGDKLKLFLEEPQWEVQKIPISQIRLGGQG